MSARPVIVPAYLLLCIMLGGASLGGYLANMLLQLLAVPIIFAALLVRSRAPMTAAERSLLALGAAAIAWPLVQLVPLPPSVWTALPGRGLVAEGFALLDQPLPWLPLTLAPERALATVLWTLPAIAVLLGIVRLGGFRASWIAITIVAGTIFAIGIGAAQAADRQSFLYFYDVTNLGLAVGFFANANHMATLLVIAIPFATALLLGRPPQGRDLMRRRSGKMLMLGAVFSAIVAGLLLNNSLAAIGLAVPALGASLLITMRGQNVRLPAWVAVPGVVALTVISVAAIFLAPLGNNLIGEGATSSESRRISIGRTVVAAGDFFPLGSGLGSFEEVYRTYEDPNQVTGTYMNHAHSDFAELLLELGLPGALLVLLILLWWLQRTVHIWAREADALAKAATVASGVIIAHSLVDYPLRTAAIAAILAACLGLMAESRERGARRRLTEDSNQPRHLSA